MAQTSEGTDSYLAWYVLPISLVALVLAYFFVPKNLQQATAVKQSFSESFKQVFLNKSAAACLIGNMFLAAAGMWSFFAATFWRKYYSLPIEACRIDHSCSSLGLCLRRVHGWSTRRSIWSKTLRCLQLVYKRHTDCSYCFYARRL